MKYCLYFTYDGLLDPLGQSQILPYIRNLNKSGHKFIILSYEKTIENKDQIKLLKNKLTKSGNVWIFLPFKKGKIHFILRIIFGAICIKFILLTKKISFVHLRGCFPGLIYKLSFSSKNYLYDLRAFFGQWADGGITRYNSLAYKFSLSLERRILKKASAIVVLDASGKEYIEKYYSIKKPLYVITTSTDLKKYKFYELSNSRRKNLIKLVYLGGGKYPPYRIIDSINLIKKLIEAKVNFKIDFINKNDQDLIEKNLNDYKIPKSYYSIKKLEHAQIYEQLPKYDIGLVFLEKGKWIRMSSPTKIGEYLASGLVVIGNKNVEVIKRLSLESENVEILRIDGNDISYSKNQISNLIKKVKNKKTKIKSLELAKKYYSLDCANAKYELIYKLLNKS